MALMVIIVPYEESLLELTFDLDKVEYGSYCGLPPNPETIERRLGEKIIAKGV
jgi:hypothetical protein